MKVLSAYMLQSFVDRMVERIEAVFPKQYQALGEPETRKLIHDGIEKGTEHGIHSERDVATLIELMVEFGSDFEMQRQRHWARELLQHPDLSGQGKIEILYLRLTGQERQ